MFRYQIAVVLRKPQVRVKLAAITLLFCFNVIDQLKLLPGFAEDMGGGELTVAVFLCHIFNYWSLYHMVVFVGFILLVPDIVCEEYMERQYLMLHKSRVRAAGSACLRLFVFSAMYVLWLIFLAVLISGISRCSFSLEWPHFIKKMISVYSGSGQDNFIMSLIMLPDGALEYSPAVLVGLFALRTFLGLLFLAELACLIRLLTGRIQNGILAIAILIAYVSFIYYSVDGGRLSFCKPNVKIYDARVTIDLIKTTILPFFTFRSMTDDFTEWLRYGILAGLVLVIITGIGIVWYYKKGDLGDADRNV